MVFQKAEKNCGRWWLHDDRSEDMADTKNWSCYIYQGKAKNESEFFEGIDEEAAAK